MIKCAKCGEECAKPKQGSYVPSISGGIMGDEYIESYYFCEQCEVYTVEVVHDRFLGEESVSFRGPVSKAEGDAKIEIIRSCSEPWDKKCRCEAHRKYFGQWLD